MTPTLVLAAHGSRDPRFAATASRIASAVGRALPDTDVRLGYLDLNRPSVPAVLTDCDAAVVVPLLLGDAYHSRVDLPALIDAARRDADGRDSDGRGADGAEHVHQTPTLADPVLTEVLAQRLGELGLRGDDGVIMAAVGSSHAQAETAVRRRAQTLSARLGGLPVVTAFATRPESVQTAVRRLDAAGAARLVVSPYFLSAGTLTERIERQLDSTGADWAIAGPMGAHRQIIDLVCRRFHAARAECSVGMFSELRTDFCGCTQVCSAP